MQLARAQVVEPDELLPASVGHAVNGTAPRVVPARAIEAFLPEVSAALRVSRATNREHGFLAYVPSREGAPLVAEPMSEGDEDSIAWTWREPLATVAFSFHTHTGHDALCVPSGIDIVGALIRGDNVVYVLTNDGRLTGWRVGAPDGHPRALMDALLTLVDAGRLEKSSIAFFYAAADAMRRRLARRVYSARVLVDEEAAAPDARLVRVRR